MLRINQRSTGFDAARLESDRDALPFPTGGVFGTTESDTETTNVAADALAHIDRIQRGIDELNRDVNDQADADVRAISGVIGRIRHAASGSGSWPPAAA